MPVNRYARRQAQSRKRFGAAVSGSKSVRRLLKGLPDAMRAEIVSVLQAGGAEIAAVMRGRAPRGATGRLAAGIAYKVYPKQLRLVIGYLGKRTNRKLFYARILNFGRKAQTVTVSRRKAGVNTGLSRGRKNSADVAAIYHLRVKPLSARHFVTGRFGDLRQALNRRLRGAWDRAMGRIATGGDE